MAHLLSDQEYAAVRKLIEAGGFSGFGLVHTPGFGVSIDRGAKLPQVIRSPRGDACAVKDIRYNASVHAIQITKVCTEPEDGDWETRVQFDPCPTTPSTLSLYSTTNAGDAGFDDGGILYGDSLVQLGAIKKNSARIDTADTSTDGSGSGTRHLMTFGASGGTLFRVKAKATGATGKDVIRIFGEPGGASTFTADAGTDVITVSDRGMDDLTLVRLTTTAADLPDPLATGTDYWVIRLTATTFKLATSYADAVAGTAVDITDAGTGTHTITPKKYLLGEITVTETNPRTIDRTWEGVWIAEDQNNGETMDAYEKIYVSTYSGNTYDIRGHGADL